MRLLHAKGRGHLLDTPPYESWAHVVLWQYQQRQVWPGFTVFFRLGRLDDSYHQGRGTLPLPVALKGYRAKAVRSPPVQVSSSSTALAWNQDWVRMLWQGCRRPGPEPLAPFREGIQGLLRGPEREAQCLSGAISKRICDWLLTLPRNQVHFSQRCRFRVRRCLQSLPKSILLELAPRVSVPWGSQITYYPPGQLHRRSKLLTKSDDNLPGKRSTCLAQSFASWSGTAEDPALWHPPSHSAETHGGWPGTASRPVAESCSCRAG